MRCVIKFESESTRETKRSSDHFLKNLNPFTPRMFVNIYLLLTVSVYKFIGCENNETDQRF